MTHLDQLESQSVYILREAFNRIDRLAMLWSMGKDSNVIVWLARKAFFGHVPFPAVHVDTGKKFPEMYAFRERYAAEWKLNLLREDCPPFEMTDPTLPTAARWGERKTLPLFGRFVHHFSQGHPGCDGGPHGRRARCDRGAGARRARHGPRDGGRLRAPARRGIPVMASPPASPGLGLEPMRVVIVGHV